MTEFHLGEGAATWTIEVPAPSHMAQLIEETGQPYEYEMLERIRRQTFTGTAVDVGAHIGNHPLYLATVCHLQVIAFEPIFVDELLANIVRNGLEDRIAVQPYALGRARGRMTDSGERVITDLAGQVSEGRLLPEEGEIEVRPLDELELSDVSLVKIDVEGMEPEVLAGAAETLKRCGPSVYAEAPDDDASRRIGAVLRPLGYGRAWRTRRMTPREEWRPR